jgi:ubiquinone/menaquinone biosynthesis C-methylase UbiE
MSAAAFDTIAAQYDRLWTESPVGRLQREAAWRAIDPLFRPGDSVLDLGCGTGEDALHLMAAGVTVQGIDASPAMVEIARGRGVNARALEIESIDQLEGEFDGAISNFGPLNCVSELEPLADGLGRLVRRGGHIGLCIMGPCCLWEIAYFLSQRAWGKAFRRWRRGGTPSSSGVRVFYPSLREVSHAFRRQFRLACWYGIGVTVPPSYVRLPEGLLATAAAVDRRIWRMPLLRAVADHRLLVFRRI